MKKVIMCDPPSGWQYGFPRAMPEDVVSDGSKFNDWLVGCGYPQQLIDSFGDYFYIRQWEQEVEDDA